MWQSDYDAEHWRLSAAIQASIERRDATERRRLLEVTGRLDAPEGQADVRPSVSDVLAEQGRLRQHFASLGEHGRSRRSWRD